MIQSICWSFIINVINNKKKKYYFDVLKKYAVFKGRASRKEYWMFFIFNLIVAFLLGVITGMIVPSKPSTAIVIGYIYGLVMFIPSLAVQIRRTHDSNKSGWFILVPIYNLILLFLKGTEGDNKYGPNPNVNETLTSYHQ